MDLVPQWLWRPSGQSTNWDLRITCASSNAGVIDGIDLIEKTDGAEVIRKTEVGKSVVVAESQPNTINLTEALAALYGDINRPHAIGLPIQVNVTAVVRYSGQGRKFSRKSDPLSGYLHVNGQVRSAPHLNDVR